MTNEEFYKSISKVEVKLVDFYRSVVKDFVPQGSRVLEIGSGWGLFTRACLMQDYGIGRVKEYITIDKIPEPKDFKKNTQGFESRIKKFTCSSAVFTSVQPDNSFDFIFIDGDHGYNGFSLDFSEALRLLKPGGTIMVDDVFHYHNWDGDYGIVHSLGEMCLKKGLEVSIYPYGNGVGLIKNIEK